MRFNGANILLAIFSLCLLSHCGSSKFSSSNNQTATQSPSPSPIPAPASPVPQVTTQPIVPALPSNAVTQGSFSAWAVPPNPAPLQNYQIYIQVKLPSNTANYTLADLSGNLVGTDAYQQTIGRNPVAYSSITNATRPVLGQGFNYNGSSTALLIVPVPGAASAVTDTVNINSILLNESQTLIIKFQ